MDHASSRLLSSKMTRLNKWLFPVGWFGCLAVFCILTWPDMIRSGHVDYQLIIVPLVMAVLEVVVMQHLVFDLADEVWDEGDALRVRTGDTEARIALQDIVKVRSATFTHPPRITLMLREPGVFGEAVTFSPPMMSSSFGPEPIAKDLTVRAAAARQRGQAS